MNFRLIVSCVIEKDGKLLFGRKPPGIGPYADTWHLIGGGVNPLEESLEEAVKREIKEETGIEVQNIRKIGFDEDTTTDKHNQAIKYIFLYFHVEYRSGDLAPHDDISELKWVEKANLRSMQLNKPSIKVFKQLGWL